MRTDATITWFNTTFPVIKWLDEANALIAHRNGAAICNAEWLMSMSPRHEDNEALTVLKEKAADAYREFSWPHLRGQFYPEKNAAAMEGGAV